MRQKNTGLFCLKKSKESKGEAMRRIKLWTVYFLRFILKAVYIVPVKKRRIYLSSNRGTSISCNPWYIFEYMREKYPHTFEYIWEYDKEADPMEDVKYVKPHTAASVFYMLTSGIIISNDGIGSFIPKRKSQCFINTWHGGGAYKRVGGDTIQDPKDPEVIINRICGGQTDVFLSGCKKFTEVMHIAKAVPTERFLECGMPRNDFLIHGTDKDVKGKVYRYFGLDPETKIVLFAPTYRGVEGNANFDLEIDIKGCIEALKKRFGGEWVFLMRKHHFVEHVDTEGCIDAGDYPDMQELLYTVDVFITDYSSTIWDYSLTYKPGFLFAPDFDQYESERNFYSDPETWAFPIAKTNQELQKLILDYDDDKNREKIETHHELLGDMESGHATETVVRTIRNFLVKERNR